MILHSLLDEPTFSVIGSASQTRVLRTLPGVFDDLVHNRVEDFPALRPHQRHVWHAFLVQLAALHMHQCGTPNLPESEIDWRVALLALTPNDGDGAAWSLVTPLDRPAFLQSPVPENSLSGFKTISTPDDLDLLVTAKNHDVKRQCMRRASAEYWAFALLSLQTQEGFLGAGNYGISRMNGGFASRPAIGVIPQGGLGQRFLRDARRLLALRSDLLDDYSFYPANGGHSLLWILPWDGTTSLSPTKLELYYIEVCRRVRLIADDNGSVRAMSKGSATARVDGKSLKGRTGDGWTPLMDDGAERKALTIDDGSFGYKRIAGLLFPRSSDANAPKRAPLQEIAITDERVGLSILARGLVRGQGKTQGYRERRVRVSASIHRFLSMESSDVAASVAASRLEDAATLARKVLYPSVLTVFTAAPLAAERKRDDDSAKNRTGRVLSLFDQRIDSYFFDALSDELDVIDDEPAALAVRSAWLLTLKSHGQALLEQCAKAAPSAAMRSYRTRARASDVFAYGFGRHFGERIVGNAPRLEGAGA